MMQPMNKSAYPESYSTFTKAHFKHKLYTDGSWNPKTGAGGWAVTSYKRVLKSGNDDRTTSIQMEVRAMINALKIAKPDTLILTDNRFVISSINVYCPAWERGGWVKDMKNKELMKKLWKAWENRADGVHIKWIRGHTGNIGNETADIEAVRQRRSIERSIERKHYALDGNKKV